ncbi:MAG: hypothetical protein EXS13_10570 [Planctomycetes bacterium]|nr:hypothetical protein [Planctomycetota bacterium]
MAFSHFHRNRAKYLGFFLVATVFSLLVFPITSELTDMASNLFGKTTGRFTFTTSGGKQVAVEDETIQAASVELAGAVGVFAQLGGIDSYSALSASDRTYAHLILLADAEELGIAPPAGRAHALIDEFKQFVQQRNPTRKLLVSEWHAMLAQMRLTEDRLEFRLGELAQVEAYVRAMKGVRVLDPVRVHQLAMPKATLVTLDHVELPFQKFKDELRAAPPADADLETWWKGLAAEVIEKKYTRSERYTIDLVALDVAAWDPATVAAELVAADLLATLELTDEEYLADGKRDALRYFGDRSKVPAAAADVTPEARAKILKDRQLKATFEKLRADFDAAVAALPPLVPPAALAPDADDAAKEAAKLAAQKVQEERAATETVAFAGIVAKYGFAVTTVADKESKELADLDPPKDTSLQFLVRGLSAPGQSGIRTQSVLPTGERIHGYLVRKAAADKDAEPKPFAEVKEDALAQWIDEHAEEKAKAKGEELLAALLAEAEKLVPAEVLDVYKAELKAGVEKLDQDKELDDDQRTVAKKAKQSAYVGLVSGYAGARYGAHFLDIVKSLGLDAKRVGPHRRDVSSSWYFNDRFSGAERFLFRQNRFATSAQDSSGPSLLSLATGAVLNEVLVDTASGAAYVAMVASSVLPAVGDLTARDRQQAERDLQSEWSRYDNPFMMQFRQFAPPPPPAYENPFAMVQIARRHHPKLRVNDASQSTAGASPYGY